MLLDVAMSRHETIFNVLRIFAHNAYVVAVSGRKPYCRPSVLEKIFLRVMLSMLRAKSTFYVLSYLLYALFQSFNV